MQSTDKMFLDEGRFLKVKKSRFWIGVILVLVVIFLVGILSGVLSAKSEREKVEAEYASSKTKRNKDPATKSPPTKAPPSKKPSKPPVSPSQKTAKPTVSSQQPTSPSQKPTQASCTGGPWCNIRLPTDVIPFHYNLKISADVDALKFNGTQKMFVNVTMPTKYVLFHYKEMDITSWRIVRSSNMQEVLIKAGYPKPLNEYFVIEATSEMGIGNYEVEVTFAANVSIKLTGFYKSTYTNRTGQTRTLLTTKFQPTDARKAYPCMDEPDLKATFNITMVHPSEYKALSNMPVESNVTINGITTTKFGKTVKMSTYLVAFIVCDFAYKENITGIGHNITMRVYSSPPQVNNTDYGLRLGTEMMTYLEEFFGVVYPMPKLDFVAIPDYGSGATEHWGVITYREARLLYTKGISSEGNKESIANIVAHECAHLWFGNLVTCKWWNDLWVQEGMASYIEYYAVDKVHPNWEMMTQFFTSDWRSGMSLDALASSHAISLPVTHPKQIKEIFDSITYRKGSSIIRMLDHYLGVEKFRKGLKEYLTAHQFAGATSDDLWRAFDKATGEDILNMMKTWTNQMGHPLINITVDPSNATKAVATQKHFLIDPKANVTVASPYNYKWIVPLSYVTEDQPNFPKKVVLNMTSATLSGLPPSKWIKANYKTTGFFRVTYSNANWELLIKQLDSNHNIFHALDRAGIIDDAFNLARAGKLAYKIALGTTRYLHKEKNYVVWRVALSNLNYMKKILSNRPSYSLFKKYMLQKLNPMVKEVGWNQSSGHLDQYKQSLFLANAISYGDESSVNHAKMMFNDWMVNNKTIRAQLKSLIYSTGVESGGAKEWDFVFGKFRIEKNPTEKSKLQSALSSTQKPWILRKWLGYSLDSSIIRSQDTVYVITDVSGSNPVGKYVAWDFARANWVKCMEIMTANNFHVTRMTLGITTQFTTEFELQQVREFWKKYPDAGAGARARIQGMERIQASIDWAKNYASDVEDWLKNEVKV